VRRIFTRYARTLFFFEKKKRVLALSEKKNQRFHPWTLFPIKLQLSSQMLPGEKIMKFFG